MKNLTEEFFENVRRYSSKAALIEPLLWNSHRVLHERVWSFREFGELVRKYQRRLEQVDLIQGDRVLILLPVSVNLYALVAACFANGIVPIFIDSTIGREQFLKALKKGAPAAVFSTRQFLKFRFLLPALWRPRLYSFDHNGVFLTSWDSLQPRSNLNLAPVALPSDSTALITFTSGSTGEPKAADRRLDLLIRQSEISRRLWKQDGNDDVELTAFPLVVLNNLVHGVTTVLPPLGQRANLDSIDVGPWISLMQKYKVTRFVAPPSIMAQLSSRPEVIGNRLHGPRGGGYQAYRYRPSASSA